MVAKYQPDEFEKKWSQVWDKEKIYKAVPGKKKQYVLAMFPYPSGAGLHVGHVRNYTGTDVVARYFRMNGYSVLHPMGWDAFGLPAENAAIKAKKNPMDMVPEHIDTFRLQMKSLGFSYDWDREFATTSPSYYKWTQWLFIQFYKMGLLYKKDTPINYCPVCKTGLAEEEVLANGTHERCGNKISKRDLPQWIFKITQYADRLLSDLDGLKWPPGILEMQRNWIGKDKGLNIDFTIDSPKGETITVWTKFWETVFGTTFLVVAPEHAWVKKLVETGKATKEVLNYIEATKAKTEEKRMAQVNDKTGVFTGFYVINPVNGKKVPVWVADYVLSSVGTGAVMGVPAHDERDFQFVKKFNLPIIQVVSFKDKNIDEKVKRGESYHEGDGNLVNSGQFDGQGAWGEGKENMAKWMIEKGFAQWKTNYHLRDWIFSRQRYWGEPIPMINCEKCGWQPVQEDQLPLELPHIKSYEPTETGESPLSLVSDWVKTSCPKCKGPAKRETDTMPNWAGSCWYFLRFADSKNEKEAWSTEAMTQWEPVDWYLGGAEHAVLHLLYSRFWVKALYDLKLLNFKEPFIRLRNQGMVLAEDHRKMSKSFGNVINPDEVVKEYGADALRIYEMFMAPFNTEIPWSTKALQGSYRFVKRVWDLYQALDFKKSAEDKKLVSKLGKTIRKITDDIPEIKFNTSIASMMEFLNDWEKNPNGLSRDNAAKFLKALAPFAPFMTEEIWKTVFGEKESIHLSMWPKVEGEIVEAEIVIPVQVMGRLRSTVKVSGEQSKEQKTIEALALKDEKVKKYLDGKKYKVIYVPGKILNFIFQ